MILFRKVTPPVGSVVITKKFAFLPVFAHYEEGNNVVEEWLWLRTYYEKVSYGIHGLNLTTRRPTPFKEPLKVIK